MPKKTIKKKTKRISKKAASRETKSQQAVEADVDQYITDQVVVEDDKFDLLGKDAVTIKKEEKANLKLYFNEDTHKAIVQFQSEPLKKDRDKLYVEKIMPAFEKLVENLINIYKFTSMHDT